MNYDGPGKLNNIPVIDPEADDEPEAFCNQCGGRLVLMAVDKDNPFPYRCSVCGGTPLSRKGPPKVRNLAMSYSVNLDYGRGPK